LPFLPTDQLPCLPSPSPSPAIPTNPLILSTPGSPNFPAASYAFRYALIPSTNPLLFSLHPTSLRNFSELTHWLNPYNIFDELNKAIPVSALKNISQS